MARPKKYNIDTEEVYKLASYGCSNVEIADFYGCDESLIRKSYSEYTRKGRASGKTRLRQLQWDSAEAGNVTMQIFLGKNMLGQQDKIEQTELDEPLVWSAD
jgi:hypothetical protein